MLKIFGHLHWICISRTQCTHKGLQVGSLKKWHVLEFEKDQVGEKQWIMARVFVSMTSFRKYM
jgi:hypothetical protein